MKYTADFPLERLSLGAVITELRMVRGFSQGELSAGIGVAQSSLSRYERGQSALALGTASRVAARLAVSLDELDELQAEACAVIVEIEKALEACGLPVPDDARCEALAHVAAQAVVKRWLLKPRRTKSP